MAKRLTGKADILRCPKVNHFLNPGKYLTGKQVITTMETNTEFFKIKIYPPNLTVEVPPKCTVLKALELAGVEIQAICGGNGVCRKCRVKKISGILQQGQVSDNVYLACQALIFSDVEIEILQDLKPGRHKIMERGQDRPLQIKPNVVSYRINLPEPALADQRPDFERITDCLTHLIEGQLKIHEVLWPTISQKLRENNFSVNVILVGNELVEILPATEKPLKLGCAFDIGTTTVAGALVDVTSGNILATESRTNPQAAHGADVMARIDFSEVKNGLQKLASEIRECLNEIIAGLCDKAQVVNSQIYEMTIAGNTTMLHLLMQLPCGTIARAPYVPLFKTALNLNSEKYKLYIHPAGNLHLLPTISGYVGADTTAAILAAGMHKSEKLQLLIDIGTNGEIVLGTKERLIACSTAAGPAFEGARILHGMRGATGAIEHVIFDDDISLTVIGGTQPKGICGSGIIDVVGELIRTGIIDQTGRFVKPENLPKSVPEAIQYRLKPTEKGYSFELAQNSESEPIVLTQQDVREVQLAKAAIFAGIGILLSEFNASPDDLDKILIAGAFGNFIRPHQAPQVGLIPNVPEDKIHFIGNAAIEGSLRTLLSKEEREEIKTIAAQTEFIELSTNTDFQNLFVEAMFFNPVL